MSATLDRKTADAILQAHYGNDRLRDLLLDALEGCVRPAPAQQTIDRDALVHRVGNEIGSLVSAAVAVDAVLALLWPDGGVHLTREEAHFVIDVLHASAETLWPEHVGAEASALAARLEAAT